MLLLDMQAKQKSTIHLVLLFILVFVTPLILIGFMMPAIITNNGWFFNSWAFQNPSMVLLGPIADVAILAFLILWIISLCRFIKACQTKTIFTEKTLRIDAALTSSLVLVYFALAFVVTSAIKIFSYQDKVKTEDILYFVFSLVIICLFVVALIFLLRARHRLKKNQVTQE